MGFSKSKTIQRNPISGQHEYVQAPLGPGKDYGRNEIIARENARTEALKSAIEGQNGDDLNHPAWKEAIQRLKADRDRQNAETNAKESDTPELTARKEKRS